MGPDVWQGRCEGRQKASSRQCRNFLLREIPRTSYVYEVLRTDSANLIKLTAHPEKTWQEQRSAGKLQESYVNETKHCSRDNCRQTQEGACWFPSRVVCLGVWYRGGSHNEKMRHTTLTARNC